MRLLEPLRAAGATLDRLALLAGVAWRARRAVRARTVDERSRARAVLCDLLGEARGLALKVGQVAASMPGQEDLGPVASTVEPRPLADLYPALARGLGRDPGEVFSGIEAVGKAASLGQVHRARLRGAESDGPVAVKIRYPGIRRAVGAELALAGLVPGVGPVKTWGFDLAGYKRFVRAELDGELDYVAEARRQGELARALPVRGLVVPRVFPELCGDGVLVQSWEDGVPLEHAAGWSLVERAGIARVLIETFFTGLFVAGRVHADPNPGNLAVRRTTDPEGALQGAEPEVVLYDYGCVLEIDEPRRLALLRLLLDLREGTPAEPAECLVAAGFDADKLAALGPGLEPLCRVLFEPLLLDRPFDPDRWRLGERLEEILGELKWWFRSAGPPDLLLLVRALHGLTGQLRTLDVALPWWPLLRRAVGDEGLTRARAHRPPALPSGAAERLRDAARSDRRARLLKVRVDEEGRAVRSVALPAIEAVHLDTLVPASVRSRLEEDGVDLAELGESLWHRGLPEGEVLRGDEGDRSFRVWLE